MVGLCQMGKRFMNYSLMLILNIFFVCNIFGQTDTVIFNKNDSTFLKGTIVKSERIGSWFKFDKNNKVLETIIYKSNNNATVRTYNFNTGSLSEKYDCIVIVNEDYKLILNGQYESYDDLGKVMRKGRFINNLGDGLWIDYNAEGDTLNLMYYKYGKLTGEWKEFYASRKIKSEGIFENDLKVGKWKEYYTNGKIQSEGEYYPSKKHVSYSKDAVDSLNKCGVNTQIIMFPIEVFAKNKKWIYNNIQGHIIKEETWDKGVLLDVKEYNRK